MHLTSSNSYDSKSKTWINILQLLIGETNSWSDPMAKIVSAKN